MERPFHRQVHGLLLLCFPDILATASHISLNRTREVMLGDLEGKNVKIYLALNPWGESSVEGKVTSIDDTWLRLSGKKGEDIVPISGIKKISIKR